MFAYADAARYRVGVNYQHLPTNRAHAPVYTPFQRDGFMNFTDNYGSDPNYVGSTLQPTPFKATGARLDTHTDHEKWVGEVTSFSSEVGSEDFEQPAQLWNVLGKEPGHQDRYVSNVAHELAQTTNSKLRLKAYGEYSRPRVPRRLRGITN